MKVKIQSKTGHKTIHITRRKAIREKCLNCTGWFAPEVKDCKMKDCNLYPFRMGVGKQDAKERAKAIRDYCLWCCNESRFEVGNCPSKDCPLWCYRNWRTNTTVKI